MRMGTPGRAPRDESLTAPWIAASPCAKLAVAKLVHNPRTKSPNQKTPPKRTAPTLPECILFLRNRFVLPGPARIVRFDLHLKRRPDKPAENYANNSGGVNKDRCEGPIQRQRAPTELLLTKQFGIILL